MPTLRVDLEVIANLVDNNSRILDLGCGDGLLLDYLLRHKGGNGFGVELDHKGVHTCISRGLPVYQGDIDQGLSDHHDDAFDYVILSQTLQATRRPRFVVQEMLRVGKRVIVSFPNFAYWRVRFGLFLTGRMPRTKVLPHRWYDTPNIHMCSIKDFKEMCDSMEINIIRQLPLAASGGMDSDLVHSQLIGKLPNATANLLAPLAIFLLERRSK
ncbi:MAG: methionine biosynthesis protein MetW [Magnetococcales bacterium]|nr:methionine biosynthesis protein MetW [Magnetococcales bacterium]